MIVSLGKSLESWFLDDVAEVYTKSVLSIRF
jgi:hypothetical protein